MRHIPMRQIPMRHIPMQHAYKCTYGVYVSIRIHSYVIIEFVCICGIHWYVNVNAAYIAMCLLVCASWYVPLGMCLLLCASWYVPLGICLLVCAAFTFTYQCIPRTYTNSIITYECIRIDTYTPYVHLYACCIGMCLIAMCLFNLNAP